MNQRERNALDRHITGNYGEDELADLPESIPPEFPELDYAAEQAAADEQWRAYLKREGKTEEQALAEAMDWCDAQD